MTLRTLRNLGLGMLSMAFLLTAGFAQAAITSSAHDFSAIGWAGGEICVVCHTPHNADTTMTDAPLWNHDLSAVASYTVYGVGSTTLNATVDQPTGVSKLCLSCHDGTVAIDSFGGATGGALIASINANADLGSTLANDHPVSFTYDDTLAAADGELAAPSSGTTSLGGTINADLLFGGSMECSSCHDVHNANDNDNLLVIDNAASALCLTCHVK